MTGAVERWSAAGRDLRGRAGELREMGDLGGTGDTAWGGWSGAAAQAAVRRIRAAANALDAAGARAWAVAAVLRVHAAFLAALPLPALVARADAAAARAVAALAPEPPAPLTAPGEVVTLVGGVGSSSPGGSRTLDAWASEIGARAWHGYAAPATLLAGASPAAAEAGAEALREHQRRLREQHPGARLHVVGHSYGSVLAGRAASGEEPLEADALTFLGSPGTGVRRAADLHVHALDGDPEIRSVHAPGDLIQLATGPAGGVHGPDPSSPGYGADNAPTWRRYVPDRAIDAYLWLRGARDAHGDYRSAVSGPAPPPG